MVNIHTKQSSNITSLYLYWTQIKLFRRRATTIRFFSQHLHLSDHLESTALQGNETAFWYFLVQSLLPLYPRTFALEIWRVPGYKGAPFADQPEFHERLTIVT
jgi:hypothetical protein